jgi:hypothetical protein
MGPTPAMLDMVRLVNRTNVYVVVGLDADKKLVDLVAITGTHHALDSVPVGDLRQIEVKPVDD